MEFKRFGDASSKVKVLWEVVHEVNEDPREQCIWIQIKWNHKQSKLDSKKIGKNFLNVSMTQHLASWKKSTENRHIKVSLELRLAFAHDINIDEWALGARGRNKVEFNNIHSCFDHTQLSVQFQQGNCWGLYFKVDVGPPLFTLLQS